MIAPLRKPAGKKCIKLLPQEREGTYWFQGRSVVTKAALEKFGEAVIAAAFIMLEGQVKQKGGLDYLQVFDIDGQRLWFIDDVSHVTALLPSDY